MTSFFNTKTTGPGIASHFNQCYHSVSLNNHTKASEKNQETLNYMISRGQAKVRKHVSMVIYLKMAAILDLDPL